MGIYDETSINQILNEVAYTNRFLMEKELQERFIAEQGKDKKLNGIEQKRLTDEINKQLDNSDLDAGFLSKY